MSKNKTKKKATLAVLSAVTIGTVGMMTVACGKKIVGTIDAPETLQAELGTYSIPEYDVVDEDGMILYGYTVKLKSATDASGNALEITGNAVSVYTAGIYDFVYTANSKGVEDVTVKIDFADRTAPKINCDDDTIPAFFISGNSYKIPQYTISGAYEQTKCWSKVFYIGEDGTETEVETTAKRFLVDKKSGEYAIRIHVEDEVGNANDYEYKRKVDGPEHFVENKVLYLDEAFGARQVHVYQPDKYTGGFVSKDTEGAKVYGEENGAYKVSFDGKSETRDNEGIVVMDVPAVVDLTDCIELEMFVYNDSDADIYMGSMWWNDKKVKKGEWTRLTWKVDSEGWGSNKSADNRKVIGSVDITGMTIRFIFDYDQKVIPNGDFYLSSMRVIPKTPAVVTAGENVSLNKSGDSYFIGDTVELSASEIGGKTLDCFLVDGKEIGGNNFVVYGTEHTVTARYIDGEITASNMTWGKLDSYTATGEDAKAFALGESDKWAMKFDVYGLDSTKWNYFGAQVGGNEQLLGFELNKGGASGKLGGYGGVWEWSDGVSLSQEALNALFAATEDAPATVTYIRDGDLVKVFVEQNGVSHFIATVDAVKTLKVKNNRYGIGERAGEINNVPLHNIKYVATAKKTEFIHAEYNATVDDDGTPVSFEEKQYRIGDTVTLSCPNEHEGKLFLRFKVNDAPIAGNSFVITSASVTVSAEYTEPCTITLGDGLTIDGKSSVTVPQGKTVRIDYTSPAGKYFYGLSVRGGQHTTNVYTVNGNVTIEGIFLDRVQNSNAKLNDISKAGEKDGVVYHSKNDWKPNKVEYVTNFGYDGIDKTVAADNSIKVTLKGGEQSFALANGESDLSVYKELYFYAYTVSSGVKAGGWWCSDTALTPGMWTRVSFDRTIPNGNPTTIGDKSVWTDGLNQFAYRIMGGTAGTVVYVTAVYGVPYADVNVTVDNAVKDYVQFTGTCKEEQTITLSVNGAPANKAFKCFTVNGHELPVGATTYKIQASDVSGGVTIGAVFTDTSTVTFAENSGISTSDGNTVYGRDITVTLEFDESKTPQNKVFDYFKVNGTRIIGNTFVTSVNTHNVEVVFADSAAALTWVTSVEAAGEEVDFTWSSYKFEGNKLGESTHWAIEANAYGMTDVGEKWYSIDFMVGNNASIQIRLHSAGHANIQAMGANLGDGENLMDLDVSIVNACKAATESAPVKFTAIRDGDTYYVLFNGKLLLKTQFDFKADDNSFGIGGTDCGDGRGNWWLNSHPQKTYKYRTGATVSEYLTTSNVTGTSVTFDRSDGKYKLGDTVTLTAAAAGSGKMFSHFTVDGTKITGSTFTVTGTAHTVVAVYTDKSEITCSGGASVGETEVPRGSKVKLTHDAPTEGKVFDYYLLDGSIKIFDDTFTTSAESHSVEAVYAASPSAITWGDANADRYTKDNVMGETETSAWFNNKFTGGQIFGSSEYWSIKVNVKRNGDWNSVIFVTGSKEALLMRWYQDGKYFSFSRLDQGGNENAPAGTSLDYSYISGNIDAARTPEQIAFRQMMTGKLNVGTDITVVRYGDTIRVFADNAEVLTLTDITGVIDCAGNWFGIGGGYDSGSQTEITNIKFITGKEKIDAYLSTAEIVQAGYIHGVSGLDGSVVKYASADKTYTPTVTVKNYNGEDMSTPVTITAKDALNNDLTVTNGTIALPDYAGAQAITITFTAAGCDTVTATVNVQRSDSDVIMAATDFGAKMIDANGNTVSYSEEQKHGDDTGSIKVSNIASNETGIFLSKASLNKVIEFYAFTTESGIKMGSWWCCDHTLTANQWTRVCIDQNAKGFALKDGKAVIRIMGESSGKTVYISSVKTFDVARASTTQLNDLSYYKNVEGVKSAEYVTDRKYDGEDTNVKETGSLKVTVSGTGCGIATSINFETDLSNYSEVYFYVYTTATSAQAGAYWCGDTNLTANTWKKISLTKDMANGGPWNVDGTKIFTDGLKDMVFRIMNCSDGDVFYITSLYGTPKTT